MARVRESHRLKARYGSGSTDANGYRVLHCRGHFLATAQDKIYEHRLVLFAKIGFGPHLCHWCRRPLSWRRRGIGNLVGDHLDEDRTNNDPENLVPSCRDCNAKRGV